jgi:tRNA-specific 2-thiouridylase
MTMGSTAEPAAPGSLERIVCGMSGGVDSSVAAALLVAQGHEVIGVTLRVAPWSAPEDPVRRFGSCCSAETSDDARAVARQLGIAYYLLNSEAEFGRAVIDDFAREYRAGRTPVPCTVCNRDVKFGTLLGRARAWGASAVATGHYARLSRDARSGRVLLWRARDQRKDQTDFLWPLTQDQLAGARFPVGELTKDEVRDRARALGLATAEKPESHEICFVPDGDYRAFLRRRDPEAFRPGAIVDGTGRVLGRHGGLPDFTIGQRRGLGLSAGQPLYVTALDGARNAVVVGPASEMEVEGLVADQVNLIAVDRLQEPISVTAKLRHSHIPEPAIVSPRAGEPGIEVRFDRPQRAVSPGQSVVLYQGDLVVGGGVIARAL